MHVALSPGLSVARVPRRRGRRRALRATLLVASGFVAVASVTALALHAANRGSAVAPGVTDYWLLSATAAAGFGGPGAWLANRRPSAAVGWLLLAVGAGWALSSVGLEYAVLAIGAGDGSGLAPLALWVGSSAWMASLLTIAAVLPFVIPEGRLPSPRWRVPFAFAVLAAAASTVQWAVTPYESWSPSLASSGVTNPLAADWAVGRGAAAAVSAALVVAVALALASLAWRWHVARGERRQQLKWVLYGLALSMVFFALGFVLGPVCTALAALPFPAACLLAGLRLGLWDVDVVISRSLVYATLTVGVAAVYAAAVGLVGYLTGRTTGAPVLAIALVALAAEPVLRRVRLAVNRRVHGDRDEPYAALARLGARLEAAHDATTVGERVLPELVDAVSRSLAVEWATVELVDGLTIGTRGGGTSEWAALVYGGAEVGRLVVGVPEGEALRRGDRRILDRLARQAAVAAHAVLATREVQRSRETLVAAREEERRRLYQELHDGLGPSLAALALQVETARELVPVDPDQAGALLDRALPRLKATVGDVRAVVNGLRPPALDDLGLAGALAELAGRFAGPRLAVTADVDGLNGLPAAAEVAAYRIVSEALANVARHADARTATVRVRPQGGALQVTVADDGKGVTDGPAAGGVGLASMRERAAELGGTLVVRSRADGPGTVVEAVLPLAAGAPR